MVHCRGALSGRNLSNVVPWRNRSSVTWPKLTSNDQFRQERLPLFPFRQVVDEQRFHRDQGVCGHDPVRCLTPLGEKHPYQDMGKVDPVLARSQSFDSGLIEWEADQPQQGRIA